MGIALLLLLLLLYSNRNEYRKIFLGVKLGRKTLKADNLKAACELIVCTVWDPQHLTAL
jgi:hypothetical protein